MNRQIGVGEFKYGVIGGPCLQITWHQPNFGPKSPQKGLNNGDAPM